MSVTLREINADTVRAICDLRVTDEQQRFVAPNAVSIAQAYFTEQAWFRAVYSGDEPVGFVMLYLDDDAPEYFVWRFMIDQHHQGRGYGTAAMRLVIDHVRRIAKSNAENTELLISFVPAPGSPQEFYESLGFELTGEENAGELVMRLLL